MKYIFSTQTLVLVRQYNLVPILKHCVMQSMCHDGFKMDVNKFKGMPGSLSKVKAEMRVFFFFSLPYMCHNGILYRDSD